MKNYLKQITISIVTLYTLTLTNSCNETAERPSSSGGHISLKEINGIFLGKPLPGPEKGND